MRASGAGANGTLGYGVLEYTFVEQGFVTKLMVTPAARRQGAGRRLLIALEAACTPLKLFTSTNVSNQRLLRRAGRRPVGLSHGLDERDPELFDLSPGRSNAPH